MKIRLLSCDAKRPDKRGIAKMLEEFGVDLDDSPRELTEYLLDGTPIEIEVADKTSSSAFRAVRKLDIDYEMIEE
ncbi:MAG: hypothetical protein AAGI23_14790 [Bacteroidota bacterium]